MTDDDTPLAEFLAAGKRLHQLAEKMLTTRPAGIEPLDIAALFVATGITGLRGVLGPAATATYLREAAARLEAQEPPAAGQVN